MNKDIKKKLKKITAVVSALALVTSSTVFANAFEKRNNKVPTYEVERIAGKDRYETSDKIALELDKNFSLKYTFIASGEDFPDALSAGEVASEVSAPIILTKKSQLYKGRYVDDILHKVRGIYVIGGKSSISDKVFNELKYMHASTKRANGKDRFATSTRVSVIPLEITGNPGGPDEFASYDGYSYPDALVAAPFVYIRNAVYNSNKIPLIAVKENPNTEVNTMVFGGTLAKGKEQYRFAGKDRYETAVKVAKGIKDIAKIDVDTVVIASGENYPDALTAAPLAGANFAPILLTKKDVIPQSTMDYIKQTKTIKRVIIVGGKTSVSEEIEKQLKGIISQRQSENEGKKAEETVKVEENKKEDTTNKDKKDEKVANPTDKKDNTINDKEKNSK